MKVIEQLNNLKIIGSLDTDESTLGTTVINLASQFGMSNPSAPVSSNTKGIIIRKNGKKYTVILAMFNPPVILSWTSPFNIVDINKVIIDISNKNKRIGYINSINIGGNLFYQIAIG